LAYQAQDQSQSRIQNQQQNVLVTKETNAVQETEITEPEVGNLEEAVQGRVKDAPVPQLPGENGKYAGKQTDNPVIVNGTSATTG